MPDYKKNYISGFINPFDSSKELAYERMVANTFDSVEGSLLSKIFRKNFKCVVLGAKDTGVFKTDATGLFYNMPQLITWGDGVNRWKTKFTIHEDLYDTDIGNAFTSYYGSSPLINGITGHEMQARIYRMPDAYTDLGMNYYNSLRFGWY